MKLEELKKPQRIEIDLRLPLFGGAMGLVLLCGWLLLGQHGGGGELLPLPETPRAAGAELPQAAPRQAAQAPQQSKSSKKGRQQAPQAEQATRPVRDPFGQDRGTAPRQSMPLPRPQAAEPRLAGIITAGGNSLALISYGDSDICLAEGQTQAGLTLLELSEDYAVLQTPAGERHLQLTNAAGGGRPRETKTETRAEQRRSRTAAAERQQRR